MADPGPRTPTGQFLRRAFMIVREDVPEAYARMVARAPREVRLQIDDDRLTLTRADDAVEITAGHGDEAEGALRLRSTTGALLGILDGASTLLEALLDGTVFVAGDVGALAEGQSALLAFLQGCVRTPRVAALLEELRADHQARSTREPTGREAA